MPPAAGWDTENVQGYEEGSAVAPTTWTNAAWCIVVPLGVSTTWVHPAGGVMVGLPRTPIDATRTSPCCTPAGTGSKRRRPVRERGSGRTERDGRRRRRHWSRGSLGAEVLPAASDAVTVYSYVVFACTLVSAKLGVELVPTSSGPCPEPNTRRKIV